MSVVVLYLLVSPFILYYFWLDFNLATAVPACLFLFVFSNRKMGHSEVAAPITAPIKTWLSKVACSIFAILWVRSGNIIGGNISVLTAWGIKPPFNHLQGLKAFALLRP